MSHEESWEGVNVKMNVELEDILEIHHS